jgi:hypothetical protein
MARSSGTITAGLALLAALAGGALRADDWDAATDNDGGVSTDNVLFHGSVQVHDLAGPPGSDQDWYLVVARPLSSYQVVVDSLTSNIDLVAQDVQRLNATGGLVLQDALLTDANGVLSLAWQQGTGALNTFVRVGGAVCPDTDCTEFDQYHLRFFDTTYAVPRFNNSGTQSTVLIVQNATDRPCTVTHHYLSAAGTLLASSSPIGLQARGLQVLATASLVPGVSGSIRVTHTCGYGGLSGKAVSLEPATGFTFDTPLVARPN